MPEKPTAIAFLWHMHQPWYGDPWRPHFRLPWVRLHALKDYLDMICVLDEFPQAHVTFNLVPSLLVQLERYITGAYSDDVIDLTTRPAAELSLDERAWWLRMGFQINWSTNVDPYPRYRQLLEKRGRRVPCEGLRERSAEFENQELLDLQVWFSLAWSGHWLRRTNEVVRTLLTKGQGYTEDDKEALLVAQAEALALTIDKYAQAAKEGRIEISTSPFHHPILPLLCRYPDVRAAMPNVRLPAGHVDIPEDALAQLTVGRSTCQRLTDVAPAGLWPSEGSVSTPAIELAAEVGFRWAATDEHILALSLQQAGSGAAAAPRNPSPEDLVTPHRHVGVDMFFRHHQLSDRIGFDYYAWEPRAAAHDLIAQASQAVARAPGARNPVVSIILDGENCWEQYRNNGWDFLTTLYSELTRHPSLRPVTFSEYLADAPTPPVLETLFPGSWINHNFHIWAGHREDQTAWELLFATRAALVGAEDTLDESTRTKCWHHLYVAEGSDWFWWYGEDNFSDDDAVFDELFRSHLKAIWNSLGLPAPIGLSQAIKGQRVPAPVTLPVAFFTPTIDGRETHFFEWRAAGLLASGAAGGSMQRGGGQTIRSVRYGFDLDTMYLAVQTSRPEETATDETWQLILAWEANGQVARLAIDHPWQKGLREIEIALDEAATTGYLALVQSNELIEVGIEREALPAAADEGLSFWLEVQRANQSVDRWPTQGAYDLMLPSAGSWLGDWLV